MRIAGIDPGTNTIGYALIEGERDRPSILRAETIIIPARTAAPERLRRLEQALEERLGRDRPNAVAIEKLYFQKNTKTAMAVSEARGVILLTAHRHARSIGEYAPLQVKLAVTGYGRADKSHVRRMIRALFPGHELPRGDDAIDAIAIALTALAMSGAERIK